MTATQPARPDGLPAPHVWHDHDGSPHCPLPVGTVHDWTDHNRYTLRGDTVQPFEDWWIVARYRVHGYPKEPA